MPVFDFRDTPENKQKAASECSYTLFRSDEHEASPEKPVMLLGQPMRLMGNNGMLKLRRLRRRQPGRRTYEI